MYNRDRRTPDLPSQMAIPSIAEMFRHLVNTPSVSCTHKSLDQSNREVLNHLANWLEDLGFHVDIVSLDHDPTKANLVASLGSGEGGLVLAGHADTVPCEENQWDSSPFELVEKQGKYFGLGTCDMKGFYPIALSAAEAFTKHNLEKPLFVVATADEESSMAGARHLARHGFPKADVAIIGEPTDLAPVYAHKGLATMFAHITGTAGHASNPQLGNNALEAMHLAISELMDYRVQLASRFKNPVFEVQTPTINLGCLHAGDNPNRICERAELQFDIRILPEMDPEKVVREVQRILADVGEATKTRVESDVTFPVVPPFKSSADGSLIQKMAKLTNRQPQTVAFGTEAPFYSELGVETVVFGPGSVLQAHQANEFLSVNRVQPAVEIIRNLIHSYCCTN